MKQKIDPTSLFPPHEIEIIIDMLVERAETWADTLMEAKRSRLPPPRIPTDPLIAALTKPEVVDGAVAGLLAESLLEKALARIRHSRSLAAGLSEGRRR